MNKVSVIVPVYNVDKYLSECLESLAIQSYKNIEILLIDDGSTDNSPIICDEFVSKYDNFYVYHLANSGVSNARNYGLRKSSGKYIMFVDSDDIVDKNYVSTMVKNIIEKKVDMVVCGYCFKYKDRISVQNVPDNIYFNQFESLRELYKTDSIQGYSVNKIFKKSIIDKCDIMFNSNIKISEDMLFIFDYLLHCSKIYSTNKNLYYYRMRKSSASNFNNKNSLSVFDVFRIMKEKNKNSEKLFFNNYIYCYYKYKKILPNEVKNNSINTLTLLLSNQINSRTKKFILVYSFIPHFILKNIRLLRNFKNKYYE